MATAGHIKNPKVVLNILKGSKDLNFVLKHKGFHVVHIHAVKKQKLVLNSDKTNGGVNNVLYVY